MNGFSKLIGLLKFGFSRNVTYISVVSSENMAEIFPFQMFHQVVIIGQNIIRTIPFGRHKKSRGPTMSAKQIAVAFFKCKQAVNCCPNLATHIPVIQGRCKNKHITFLNCWIDLYHIIRLDAGTFPVAVAAKTSFKAVNIHFVKEKLGTALPMLFAPSVNF